MLTTIACSIVTAIFLWIATRLSLSLARGQGRLEGTTDRLNGMDQRLNDLQTLVNSLKPADFAVVNTRLKGIEDSEHSLREQTQAMHSRHTGRLEKLEKWREDMADRLAAIEGVLSLARADAADAKERAKTAEDVARGLSSEERRRRE